MKPRVYADFLKKDERGRLRLMALGSLEDIRKHRFPKGQRVEVVFYSDDYDEAGSSDDLEIDGVIEWDAAAGYWAGTIDGSRYSHHSRRRKD